MDRANHGWTLHIDTDRIMEDGSRVDRWWSGLEDLVIGGETWRGAQNPDGSKLIDVSGVKFTGSVPGRRARVRVAVPGDALRRALQVDLGVAEVTLGWVYRDDDGVWQRVPRSYRGRLGQSDVLDAEWSGEVETYYSNVDRGQPEYWSHETAPEGDLYAEQARTLEGGIDTRWPPFSVEQRRTSRY